MNTMVLAVILCLWLGYVHGWSPYSWKWKPFSPHCPAHLTNMTLNRYSVDSYANLVHLIHPNDHRNVYLVGLLKSINETALVAREVIDKTGPDLVFVDVDEVSLGLSNHSQSSGHMFVTKRWKRLSWVKSIFAKAWRSLFVRQEQMEQEMSPSERRLIEVQQQCIQKHIWPLIDHCLDRSVPVLVRIHNGTDAQEFSDRLTKHGVTLDVESLVAAEPLFRQAVAEIAGQPLPDGVCMTLDGFFHMLSSIPTLRRKREFIERVTAIQREHLPYIYQVQVAYYTDKIVKAITSTPFSTLVAAINMNQLLDVEAQLVQEHGFHSEVKAPQSSADIN